jgi:hypothetical protein
VAVLVGAILGSAPAAEAVWGRFPMRAPPPAPPDQSWLTDPPERAHSRGKIAVFAFEGDDVYQPLRGAVVRMLRRRGYNVTVTLRRVDSATEYREMSHVANLAVFVKGEVKGEGAKQRALIQLYSGVSGGRMFSMRLSGPTEEMVGELARTFWTRVGPAITRACTSVAKSGPRRLERAPLHIDAGDPTDET